MFTRAILLGLIGALIISSVAYLNDEILRMSVFIYHHMPFSVYGSLILFVLCINPLLVRINRRLAFSGRELAIILAMTLTACAVPTAGLMSTFTTSLMLPHHYKNVTPGWKEQQIIAITPPEMLADISGNEDVALNGFRQGLASGTERIAFADVPWSAWARAFSFWLPLIIVFWIGIIALSMIVHKQWSDHEQLPYPIARFADALLPGRGDYIGSVFRNRLFWLGAGIVMFIHGNNYLCKWWPQYFIPIPRSFDLGALGSIFPVFIDTGYWMLFSPRFTFAVIGVAYLIATDVSLSLGISPFLYAIVLGIFGTYGVSLRGQGWLSPSPQTFMMFGAYVGIFAAIIYTGRAYYKAIFKRAVFAGPPRQEAVPYAVWAARVFILCLVAVVIMLATVGLDWQLALLYTGMAYMLFMVLGRVLAETGLFFNQAYWTPGIVILGFMGAKAVGPQVVVIMLLLTAVLLIDPREALFPYMVNTLKIVDLQRLKVGRIGLLCGATLMLSLAVAVPATLYFQYNYGVNRAAVWSANVVPQFPFEQAIRIKQRLAAQDSLETAESVHGWARFMHISPNRPALLAFIVGAVLVLLFTLCRIRFAKWPLHPVLFLVWSSFPMQWIAWSFLAGWFIKAVVTKYGGARVFQKLKPFMFGIIAGDLIGGVIPFAIGLTYHAATGQQPPHFTTNWFL
jgi:hypothetical protein